jgi:hypothetical protein
LPVAAALARACCINVSAFGRRPPVAPATR